VQVALLPPEVSINGTDQEKMRDNFCKWKNSALESGQIMPHDAALFITRAEVCGKAEECDAVGYAELDVVCQSEFNCALVQDNGFGSAFLIAHEVAHWLAKK